MNARDHERPGGGGIVRLTTWATAAAVAITIAALASQTTAGSQRIGTAIAALAGGEPSQPAARRADLENDRRSLNEALRLLAADRDRLLIRVSSLERNLDDITGSIKRQTTARAMPENSLQDRPNPEPLPAITGEPPATKQSDPPDRLANAPERWPHPAATLEIVRGPALFPASPAVRIAALPEIQATAPTAVSRTEFGVDIGSGSDLDEVRILWNAAKAQHGKLIGNLRPIVVRREDHAGNADYRLVVGPLANAGAAAKLCATLGAADIMCSTRPYQGERLAP